MDERTDDREGRWASSPMAFALFLALGLWVMVLLLNWLGSSDIPIVEEQFRKLQTENLIDRIFIINETGIRCQLKREIRVVSEGHEFLTRQVLLEYSSPFNNADIEEWKGSGIDVVYQEEGGEGMRSWSGGLFVLALLAIGVWHIASQIKKDRSGIGSPRRRLKELELQFQEGLIGEEEYQKAAQILMAEL